MPPAALRAEVSQATHDAERWARELAQQAEQAGRNALRAAEHATTVARQVEQARQVLLALAEAAAAERAGDALRARQQLDHAERLRRGQ